MNWGSSSSPPLVSWLARSPGGFPFTFRLLVWDWEEEEGGAGLDWRSL